MSKPVITIDGAEFTDLEGFFKNFQHRALLGTEWGHNLDAFNDVLRGGIGTPEGGFVLVWQHHSLSRQRLGYTETARQLQRTLATCDSHNVASVRRDLAQALSNTAARSTTGCWTSSTSTDLVARRPRTPSSCGSSSPAQTVAHCPGGR